MSIIFQEHLHMFFYRISLLIRPREGFYGNLVQSCCPGHLDSFDTVKTESFDGGFGNKTKSAEARSGLRAAVVALPCCACEFADAQRRVAGRVVMMQQPGQAVFT